MQLKNTKSTKKLLPLLPYNPFFSLKAIFIVKTFAQFRSTKKKYICKFAMENEIFNTCQQFLSVVLSNYSHAACYCLSFYFILLNLSSCLQKCYFLCECQQLSFMHFLMYQKISRHKTYKEKLNGLCKGTPDEAVQHEEIKVVKKLSLTACFLICS